MGSTYAYAPINDSYGIDTFYWKFMYERVASRIYLKDNPYSILSSINENGIQEIKFETYEVYTVTRGYDAIETWKISVKRNAHTNRTEFERIRLTCLSTSELVMSPYNRPLNIWEEVKQGSDFEKMCYYILDKSKT